jgi:hypothetical protein
MTDISSKLFDIEEPLTNACDFVQAAWLAAGNLEKENSAAFRVVLSAAQDELSAVKTLWKESLELVRSAS